MRMCVRKLQNPYRNTPVWNQQCNAKTRIDSHQLEVLPFWKTMRKSILHIVVITSESEMHIDFSLELFCVKWKELKIGIASNRVRQTAQDPSALTVLMQWVASNRNAIASPHNEYAWKPKTACFRSNGAGSIAWEWFQCFTALILFSSVHVQFMNSIFVFEYCTFIAIFRNGRNMLIEFVRKFDRTTTINSGNHKSHSHSHTHPCQYHVNTRTFLDSYKLSWFVDEYIIKAYRREKEGGRECERAPAKRAKPHQNYLQLFPQKYC